MSLALASAAALPAQAESPFLVPYHAAEKPIVDAQGRKSIIIDFVDDAHEKFPKDPPPGWDSKASFHRPQVVNLVNAHARTHGYEPQSLTTWVGSSVLADLTQSQVERLRHDKDVKLLTENSNTVTFATSAQGMPWSASWNGSEYVDWGRNATVGHVRSSGSRKIYILDGGVAWHNDLPTIQRFNSACPNASGGTDCNSIDPGRYPLVGCWGHATHIAGIVGAVANNGATSAGVYAGADMVSVSMLSAISTPPYPCGDGQTSIQEYQVAQGLDFVYQHILHQYSYTVPIVNMSFNSQTLGFDSNGMSQTNRDKLLKLVTPAVVWEYAPIYFPGAFVAQAAGNKWINACAATAGTFRTSAGASSTAVEGIMVVGAITYTGAPVDNSTPFAGGYPSGLASPPGSSATPAYYASNYGPCVDVWAPGNSIFSTWGAHDAINGIPGNQGWYTTSTSVSAPYSGNYLYYNTHSEGWAFLSGTSMAAPHVAAAAAYVADAYGLTTPAQIESKLRDLFRTTGYNDATNQTINIIQALP